MISQHCFPTVADPDDVVADVTIAGALASSTRRRSRHGLADDDQVSEHRSLLGCRCAETQQIGRHDGPLVRRLQTIHQPARSVIVDI
jgi:hypothetical protein